MKKYRLSTTISPKHWSLLKKYTDKYETQQKALEKALESLDNGSMIGNSLSEDDKVWIRIGGDLRKSHAFMHLGYLLMLLKTADIELFREYAALHKPLVLAIEWYYQKPLKECSLQEVMDCILINSRIMNIADNITYKDQGDHYELIIIHSLGIIMSQMQVTATEDALAAYGARCESNYSERTVFIKIYKSQGYNKPDSAGGGA